MKPARLAVPRAPKRTVGVVAANWFQEQGIPHESFLEKSCILVLLLAPGILKILAQAIRLRVAVEDRTTYVPDFLVEGKHRRKTVIEARPKQFIAQDQAMFASAARLLAPEGSPFYVCSEEQLSEVRLSSAERCHDQAKRRAPAAELSRLINEVERLGRLTIADAAALDIPQFVVEHAVGRRLVSAGPQVDLSPNSWLVPLESLEDEFADPGAWLGCKPWHGSMDP